MNYDLEKDEVKLLALILQKEHEKLSKNANTFLKEKDLKLETYEDNIEMMKKIKYTLRKLSER
tara:strand:+ start:190 stop:378 length:189 start_codon:yes stop_codon:yes gene_type:complete